MNFFTTSIRLFAPQGAGFPAGTAAPAPCWAMWCQIFVKKRSGKLTLKNASISGFVSLAAVSIEASCTARSVFFCVMYAV
jgi:hypothetical protein